MVLRSSLLLTIALAALPACQAKSPANTSTAVEWVTRSEEYQAICLQTYLGATRSLEARGPTFRDGACAVVLDLDETVFDNSSFQTHLLTTRTGYSESVWNEWHLFNEAMVSQVPGAVQFLQSAFDLQLHVVFITNRSPMLDEVTRTTLARIGGDLHLEDCLILYRTADSSKVLRREQISQRFRVVAYLGDSMGDFPERTEDAPWGTEWFCLPNPVYGSWTQ